MIKEQVKKDKTRIKPTIRRSDVTRFSDLSDDVFEALCCDLHGRQKGIATCRLFGQKGQADKGVDHIAHREAGDGKDVGQSKCYQEFSESDLQKAVAPFFQHLAFWKEQDVRRYILFVACEPDRTQIHMEEEKQQKRFKAEGIVFELWSGRDIEKYLRVHRDLVEKYIESKEIQDRLCGSREPSLVFSEQHRALQLNFEAVSIQRTGLADALSESTRQLVEKLRETFRRGRRREALQGIRTLFDESQDKWLSLSVSTRGQILRTTALYTLNVEDDQEAAAQLADRAKQEDPDGDDATVRAAIAYKKGGNQAIEEAISLARASHSVEALNFQGSLLIELGRYEDALRLFDDSPLSLEENSEMY
jgi:hypothetical protein